MSDKKYPLIETVKEEEALFYSSDFQERACIGHLRGDFGCGTEFWTTWWEHHEELKGQDFIAELDDVVNALRENGPLKDLRSMSQFCWTHEQMRIGNRGSFGFRIDTARRRYYLRLLPQKGEYNFYIYCYQTDQMELSGNQMYKEGTMSESKIKVLVVEPQKPCYVQEISGLKAMQELVGGHIETVYPFTQPAVIVCNEEGKLLGLPYNRPLCDQNGVPYDVICGTFFIAGVGTEDFVSLTDTQIHHFKEFYDNLLVIPAEKEAPKHAGAKKKPRNNHER